MRHANKTTRRSLARAARWVGMGAAAALGLALLLGSARRGEYLGALPAPDLQRVLTWQLDHDDPLGLFEPHPWLAHRSAMWPLVSDYQFPPTLLDLASLVTVRETGLGPAYRVRWNPHATVEALIQHRGHSMRRVIALTFDDGPDPLWTPRVLDVLKRRGVPATFFVLGKQVQEHPQLTRRIVSQGHALGNHTWTHADISRLPPERLCAELDRTDDAIEQACGVRTKLFRAPFDVDPEPSTIVQILSHAFAQQHGRWSVGADVDSKDWWRLGASSLVRRVLEQCDGPGSHIVLLHDSGGDRAQTLDAIDTLITALRSRGYQFVTVDRLMGR